MANENNLVKRNRGTEYQEGQVRQYSTRSAAQRAHAVAVAKGFCYSAVVYSQLEGIYRLFVTGKR